MRKLVICYLSLNCPASKLNVLSEVIIIIICLFVLFSVTDSPGGDMPHFSNELLVSQRAHVENLTFSYYLRHGRPSFAFVSFVSERLKDATVSKSK